MCLSNYTLRQKSSSVIYAYKPMLDNNKNTLINLLNEWNKKCHNLLDAENQYKELSIKSYEKYSISNETPNPKNKNKSDYTPFSNTYVKGDNYVYSNKEHNTLQMTIQAYLASHKSFQNIEMFKKNYYKSGEFMEGDLDILMTLIKQFTKFYKDLHNYYSKNMSKQITYSQDHNFFLIKGSAKSVFALEKLIKLSGKKSITQIKRINSYRKRIDTKLKDLFKISGSILKQFNLLSDKHYYSLESKPRSVILPEEFAIPNNFQYDELLLLLKNLNNTLFSSPTFDNNIKSP